MAEAVILRPWREADLADALREVTGRGGLWRTALARRLIAAFGEGPRPTAARVAKFLGEDVRLQRMNARRRIAIRGTLTAPPAMWPAPGPPQAWGIPTLVTPDELAAFLGLSQNELEGFADLQGRGNRTLGAPAHHYEYAWRARTSGRDRLIESPRFRLKEVQRRVLQAILAKIPAHESAHGFCRGRSPLTHAAPHAGRTLVLGMDLLDFFPSVNAARVVGTFLTAGYPEPVARRLAGLCTHRMPRAVWERRPGRSEGPETWRLRRLLSAPHLPQGAPTSPALANLAAFGLDARLSALAEAAGACYTRYADDLAFSGGVDFARSWRRFATHVAAVALEEGFAVNHAKTRVMGRGARQQLAGVVVNEHTNIPRDLYDRLKATLHNCLRHGPASQNRDGREDFRAHLAGRVAQVAQLNPARGASLKTMLDRITW